MFFRALIAILLQFGVSAEAHRLTPIEEFPETLPGLCQNPSECSVGMKRTVFNYLTASGTVLDSNPGLTIFTGKCEFKGSSAFSGGAHALIVIEKVGGRYYAGVQMAGPLFDYNGKPTQPSWHDSSLKDLKEVSSHVVGREEFELIRLPDFSFVDTRRTDNKSEFIMWFKTSDDGEQAYALGYFGPRAVFACELIRETEI